MTSPSVRRRRWPWALAAGAVLGAALILGLLLIPSVQGWLLRRIVRSQPGWRLDFDRIGVGPTGLDARGLAFAMPGVAASSEPVTIRVAPLRLFSHRELRIERMEAHKIRLTVTPAELPAVPFRGVLHWLQAPLSWALDAAQLEGDVVVRDGGESRLTGTFSLQGGGLAPAAPGEFAYALTANSVILPPGPDHSFSSAGTIRLAPLPSHGIGRITVDGDLHPPHYGWLVVPSGKIHVEISGGPGSEVYAAQLNLGGAFSLDAAATLDIASSVVRGHATLHADSAVAASLRGKGLPLLSASGTLTFTDNLRSGEIDATVTGDFNGSDWQNLLPQLAALDALRGHLAAALARRGDHLTLTRFEASAVGEHSPAHASLTLTQPCELKKGGAEAAAQVAFAHWPIAWANPLLASHGLQAVAGEFSVAETLALGPTGVLRLTPSAPAAVEHLSLRVGNDPALPALDLTFLPAGEVSAVRTAMTLTQVSVVSANGDRGGGRVAVAREGATGEIHALGEFSGSLPTWFGRPGGTPPFTLAAAWDAGISGARLHLAALDFTARTGAGTAPSLEIKLQRPFDLDWQKLRVIATPLSSGSASSAAPASADWLHLSLSHFPLEWLSHWLPGRTVAGTVVSGESGLRPTPEGGFAWITSTPWQGEGLALSRAAASAPMRFAARLSPQFTLGGDRFSMQVDDLALSDGSGDRLSGQFSATSALAKINLTAQLALAADLPALPRSQGTFGPLQVRLQAKFHTITPRIAAADQFNLSVRTSSDELVALTAPLPFLFGLSGDQSVVASTMGPLRLKLGRFPLSWLRPWTGGLELDGLVSPAELSLTARMSAFSAKADGPWNVDGLSVRRNGRELLGGATATFTPGVDLSLLAVAGPTFKMAFTGQVQFSGVQMLVGGRPALGLDLGLGFAGNDKVLYPQKVDLDSHLDFAALPTASALGLPARGTLTTRINGDLLGGRPMLLRTRLEGVAGARAGETLPPLEVALSGTISPENVITGRAELLLAASPRPTDATFEVQLNLADGGLHLTSGFQSQFLDGAALLALARAFPHAGRRHASAPLREKIASPVAADPATSGALPFWGALGGSFDLDIGTLQFAPYRIDHVRGRFEAGPGELAMRELSGEMFAGRWGGSIHIRHDPRSATAEHTLEANFTIEQIESARVVQAVFPHQLPSIDARLNVHSRVDSLGDSFVALMDDSTAHFSVDGDKGVVRLTVPKEELFSTAAVFGGTVLLSPELRALGRLLKTFAEMPVDQLLITGQRTASGELMLEEFRLDSPEARVRGQGRIPADAAEPLMNRPLSLSLELAAKDDLAVILGGMSLLEKKPQGDGFRAMRQPFTLGGRVGAPDTAPLYDLLARAVAGSKGTWGLLMRKAQAKIVKKIPPAATATP